MLPYFVQETVRSTPQNPIEMQITGSQTSENFVHKLYLHCCGVGFHLTAKREQAPAALSRWAAFIVGVIKNANNEMLHQRADGRSILVN